MKIVCEQRGARGLSILAENAGERSLQLFVAEPRRVSWRTRRHVPWNAWRRFQRRSMRESDGEAAWNFRYSDLVGNLSISFIYYSALNIACTPISLASSSYMKFEGLVRMGREYRDIKSRVRNATFILHVRNERCFIRAFEHLWFIVAVPDRAQLFRNADLERARQRRRYAARI